MMKGIFMYGTIGGNIAAILYFFIFQLFGICVSFSILNKEAGKIKLFAGSVLGSVMLQWLPVPFSFLLGFTKGSHVLAAFFGAAIAGACLFANRKRLKISFPQIRFPQLLTVAALLVYAVFCVLVVNGIRFENGAVYSSQANYGDTSMHLGFITSIANQGTFPPEYSILPGTRLSYPFLSDSISSSLYIWGSNLKLAYCLPMLLAGAQVMGGLMLFFGQWLKSRAKTFLAWILFFLNGGFGFAYFLSQTNYDTENFTRIFTEFYQTPTNLTDSNIRWVNVIVDMLLPQRATLFGYAVLFCTLFFLYKAVFENHKGYFILAGLLGGALPMIHTHSFLALAIVSICWLVSWIAERLDIKYFGKLVKILMAVFIFSMPVYQYIVLRLDLRKSSVNIAVVAAVIAVLLVFIAVIIVKLIKKEGFVSIAQTWGIYLLVVLCLALPQLFIWTFRQASAGSFIRGYFNWANEGDNYLWFYIKNIGISLLFFVPGFFGASKRKVCVAAPALLIWFIAEFIVFQPNTYDNNKLLYVAFIFVCGIAADFMIEVYNKARSVHGIKIVAASTMLVCTVSAILTIGRELVSEYELMGTAQLSLVQTIEETTDPHDTFLTDMRHNNAIAALSGRNIVCGSPTYLYYHGLDYSVQEKAAELMYEFPQENYELFKEYSVDYILVSDYERNSYSVDEAAIEKLFTCVYDNDGIQLYKVS